MENLFLRLSVEQWVDLGISFFAVVLVLSFGRWFVALILGRVIGKVTRHTKTTLDDVFLDLLQTPLYALGVVLILNISLTRLDFLPSSWIVWMDDFFFVLYFLVVFSFAWAFVLNFFRWYGKKIAEQTESNIDKQLLPIFQRIALILLGTIGFITLLGHFQVDISAMVASLGIGSLAIALAAQSALSDMISGFLIMVDRPFRIGDRIEILDLDTWGDVIDIGLRSSRIRTRDNRMVVVPNSLIAKSLVVNYSYPNDQYRIQVHVGVAYGTDLEFARETIIMAVKDVEGVLPDQKVEALFLEFGDSAVIFRVRWWLDSYVDTRRMFDRVNTAIYNALNEVGIEMPNPQLDVHHHGLVEGSKHTPSKKI
ncbi:MAG: Small-conductance mechanosensitive channel [Chloroflexi bacterium]|nr:Small-conductance mechanosensitive channel [Chloroflexota bacterium]